MRADLGQQHAVATAYFQRALTIQPDNPNAWSNLALLIARRGDYDRAISATAW